MAPEAFRQRSAPVGGSKPLLSLLRADAEHGRAHRAVTASPLAGVVRLHPFALFGETRHSAADASDVLDTRGDEGPWRPHQRPKPSHRLGMRFFWKNASLAPRRSGFDTRRLHSRKRAASQPGPRCASHRICLRSVNGKHTPFVRTGCGFDSCRRLLSYACSSVAEHRPATAEGAGSSPARCTHADVAHRERAPERHSGEARSSRAVRSRRFVV